MHFVACPKQGLEMEAVVLHRVGLLAYFCPKQGQDFKPSAAPLYPKIGPQCGHVWLTSYPGPRGFACFFGALVLSFHSEKNQEILWDRGTYEPIVYTSLDSCIFSCM